MTRKTNIIEQSKFLAADRDSNDPVAFLMRKSISTAAIGPAIDTPSPFWICGYTRIECCLFFFRAFYLVFFDATYIGFVTFIMEG